MGSQQQFVPALIVVDMQEDFCQPNGSLAVAGGRELAPVLNSLLSLPFAIKVATQDWHPANSLTFASQHVGKTAYTDTHDFVHPDAPADGGDAGKTAPSTVWPDHCVQGTPGAELIPELDARRLDLVVRKGMDRRTEMFSGFADMFGRRGAEAGVASDDLAARLRDRGVTHVYVGGLTGDCCAKETARGAREDAGFEHVFLIADAVSCVTQDGWAKAQQALAAKGVKVVKSDGPELEWVKNLSKE